MLLECNAVLVDASSPTARHYVGGSDVLVLVTHVFLSRCQRFYSALQCVFIAQLLTKYGAALLTSFIDCGQNECKQCISVWF